MIDSPAPTAGKRAGRKAASPETTIYEAIHAAIVERRLPAGTRLVEDQMAQIFGVSRARIRQALQALARDRMVTLQPNRGAFVSFPSTAEAREVFQARRLLESALVREAARSIDAKGLARLVEHLEKERAAHQAGDRRASIKLSGDFHLLLAEIVGNATLLSYLRELTARSSLVIAIYESPGAKSCSLNDHQRIIDALKAGDGDTAAAEMDDHLGEVEAQLALVEPGAAAVDLRAIFTV